MKIQFTLNEFELTTELEKYTRLKITRLARKVPRQLRSNTSCIVTFSQSRRQKVEFNTCAIEFTLDDTRLRAEEKTLHMYSSLDIAAVHIGNQLKDYTANRGRRRIRGIMHGYVHRLAR